MRVKMLRESHNLSVVSSRVHTAPTELNRAADLVLPTPALVDAWVRWSVASVSVCASAL